MTVFKKKSFRYSIVIEVQNLILSFKTRTIIKNATKVNNGLVITVLVKIAFGMSFLSPSGGVATSVH